MNKKIYLVAGARPNFMKVAPLFREFQKSKYRFSPYLVHTGQHYDVSMSDLFFRDLKMPKPHIHLGVGSGTHAEQTARVMVAMEGVLKKNQPDLLVVVGDVNSTMASALAAAKLLIPVAHVEAGLRSRDRSMPEEINRLVTDAISDYLFTPSPDADINLIKEGCPKNRIFRVGNVMIDSLKFILPLARKKDVFKRLSLRKGAYVLLTLHRPVNVDHPKILKRILKTISKTAGEWPVVFPVHPRTKKIMDEHKMLSQGEARRLTCVGSLGYVDFVNLVSNSRFVVTDSGGVQEETSFLRIPCLTLRNTTERPITVTEGTNTLVGVATLSSEIEKIRKGTEKKGKPIKLWDGNASRRIAEILTKQL